MLEDNIINNKMSIIFFKFYYVNNFMEIILWMKIEREFYKRKQTCWKIL